MNLSEDELHALAIHSVQDELSCYICSNFISMWHGSSYWTELYDFLYSERGELTQNRKIKNNSDESEKFFRSMFIPEKWKSIWKHILCSTQMNKTRE